MLNIEGNVSIGNLIQDKDLTKSTLTTYNIYRDGEGKNVEIPEFWNSIITKAAKEALEGCQKGDMVKITGLMKSNYDKENSKTYLTITVLTAEKTEKLARNNKNQLHLNVTGKGVLESISEDDHYPKATLRTYEKYKKEDQDPQYNNMFWNLDVLGHTVNSISKLEKQYVEIKGQAHNTANPTNNKTYYRIALFNIKSAEIKKENPEENQDIPQAKPEDREKPKKEKPEKKNNLKP